MRQRSSSQTIGLILFFVSMIVVATTTTSSGSPCLRNAVETVRLPDLACSPANDHLCPASVPIQGGTVENYLINVTVGRGAFRLCEHSATNATQGHVLNGTGSAFSFTRGFSASNIASFSQSLGNITDHVWQPRCNDSLYCLIDPQGLNNSYITVHTGAWHWYWPLRRVASVPWTHWAWLQEVPGTTADDDAMDFWTGRLQQDPTLATNFLDAPVDDDDCVQSLYSLPGSGEAPDGYTDQMELQCNPLQNIPIPTAWTSLGYWPPSTGNKTDSVFWQLLLESGEHCGLNQTQLSLVNIDDINLANGTPGQWHDWLQQHSANRCGTNALACGACAADPARVLGLQSAGPGCAVYQPMSKLARGLMQVNVTLNAETNDTHVFWVILQSDATGTASVSFRRQGAGPNKRVTLAPAIVQGLASTWTPPSLEGEDGAFVVCGNTATFPQSIHNPWGMDPTGAVKPVSTVTYMSQFGVTPGYAHGGSWFWDSDYQQRPPPACGSVGPSASWILERATPAQLRSLCSDADTAVNTLRTCMAHAAVPCPKVRSMNRWSRGEIGTEALVVKPLPPSLWSLSGNGTQQPPAWLTEFNGIKALVSEVKNHMPAVTVALNIRVARTQTLPLVRERLYSLESEPFSTVCNFIATHSYKDSVLPATASQKVKDENRGGGVLQVGFMQPKHLGNPGPVASNIERHFRVQVECDAPLQISDHSRQVLANTTMIVKGSLSGGQIVRFHKPIHVQFQTYEQMIQSLGETLNTSQIIQNIGTCNVTLQATHNRTGDVAQRLWVQMDQGKAGVTCRWVNSYGEQKMQNATQLIADLSDVSLLTLCGLIQKHEFLNTILPDYCKNGKIALSVILVPSVLLVVVLLIVAIVCGVQHSKKHSHTTPVKDASNIPNVAPLPE